MAKQIKRVHIFSTGTHTSMSGETMPYTESDLDRTITKFKELVASGATWRPAVTIKHPEPEQEAFAWGKIVDLSKGSDPGDPSQFGLFGDFEVHEDCYKWMKDQNLPYRSSGFRTDKSLHHVALLGKDPPSLKSLANVEFAESQYSDDLVVYSDSEAVKTAYSEVNGWNIKTLFRSLRDWILEKEGMEVADRVLPSWSVGNVEIPENVSPYSEAARRAARVSDESFHIIEKATAANTDDSTNAHTSSQERFMDPNKKEPTGNGVGGETPPANFAEQMAAKEAENKTLQAKITELEKNQLPANFAEAQAAAHKAAEARIKELEERAQRAEFSEWMRSEEIDKRVTPADAPSVLSDLMAFAAMDAELKSTVNYSEGDTQVTGSRVDRFKATIARGPVVKHRGEQATEDRSGESGATLNHAEGQRPDADADRVKMHNKILAIAEEKSIEYGEAYALYMEAN